MKLIGTHPNGNIVTIRKGHFGGYIWERQEHHKNFIWSSHQRSLEQAKKRSIGNTDETKWQWEGDLK